MSEVPDSKRCPKCDERKPLDAFSRSKQLNDGRDCYCKACRKELRQRQTDEQRQRYAEQKREYRRTLPPEKRVRVSTPEQRARKTIYNREYYAARHDDLARRQAQWYERNREKHLVTSSEGKKRRRTEQRERIIALERLARCRRRAREYHAAGTVTDEQMRARISMFGDRCWVCGAAWQHIDHFKPLVAGGANWPCNLRPICLRCNSSRGGRWQGVKHAIRYARHVVARRAARGDQRTDRGTG